jgi:hypothetical protein
MTYACRTIKMAKNDRVAIADKTRLALLYYKIFYIVAYDLVQQLMVTPL